MGKLNKNDSDNQMDIEHDNSNNQMEAENANKVPKKNKKILKSKTPTINQAKSKSTTASNTSKDVVKQFAKIVNLKKSERPLTEKQQIFKKVVKGLHGKKQSKQERRKSRIFLKKELQRALQKRETKPESKAAFSTMESEKSFAQKKKKEPLNEKAEVIKMRSAMGQSLSSLKNMLAQKLN